MVLHITYFANSVIVLTMIGPEARKVDHIKELAEVEDASSDISGEKGYEEGDTPGNTGKHVDNAKREMARSEPTMDNDHIEKLSVPV